MENISANVAKNSLSIKQDARANRMKRKPMFDQTGHTLLNGVKLSFERGFGFSQDPEMNNTAHCIDDNKIVYTLGKQIIQYDLLTENQKVIDQIEQEEDITSFMYFKNLMLDDNIMYSLHAMNKTYPSVIVKNYSKNLSQRFVMAHLQKEQKIVTLNLICENKYIVALSVLQGTYRLSYIQIQTKQIVASESIYFKVSGMFIPQAYQKCVILYTANQLYVVHFGLEIKPISLGFNKSLQQLQPKENKITETIVQAISSVFTNNDVQIYLITNKGNLMFLNINIGLNKVDKVEPLFLGEFDTIDQASGESIRINRMPSSICCNEYNIIVGYHFIEEFSLIKICPIMNQMPTIQKVPFSCPNLHKIVRMQFAHQTMSICVIVQVKQNDRFDLSIPIQSEYLKQKGQQSVNKQSLTNHNLKPGKIFPVVFNMLLHDTLVQTLRSPIQSILGWMLFVKEIMDIAILPTKKIMLILSKQRKIKAVKYEHLSSTSFERMLIWEMHFNHNDYPSCLDIHPLTFNVAVGFKQGLKLFTISSEGLKPNNIQFPLKNCESVKFSKFGHKLIAGSLNQIIVINPYENKILNTINLNSGYNTKELLFIDRDMYIFSQFGNGSAMVLNSEGNKIFEVWKKQNKALCSAYDSVFDIMVVSYNQSFTKFYRQRGTQQFGVLWTYPFNITKILIVNELGTIFMGTSMGKIRAYQWPFTDMMRFNKSYTEIQLHSSPITKLKIIHDYSLLISGAQDGSIFISKINAYSDGIAITDAEIMHSLKSGNKNFTNLFYLQNFMITSNNIQFGQEQTIVQLESDKADFESQYSQVIMTIEKEMQERLKNEQSIREKQFRAELQSRQLKIEQLNDKKVQIRDQINEIIKKKAQEQEEMQSKKLVVMRQLYKQSDLLKEEKQQYIKKFKDEISRKKQKCQKQLNQYKKELKTQQDEILKEIAVVQKDYHQQIVNYEQLIKQENEQGNIYKTRMLEELDNQLENQKDNGERLRKHFNKIRHDNQTSEEKLKNFQQMITELEIDTETNINRNQELKTQENYLASVLNDKDKTILEEEKNVKELLSKNINNYSHEQYLKYRQQELIEKVKFLQDEIVQLDSKYNTFQTDFVEVTNQSNSLTNNIQSSNNKIQELKKKDNQVKQILYAKKYRNNQLINQITQAFHDSKCDREDFYQQVRAILSNLGGLNSQNGTEDVDKLMLLGGNMEESSEQKTNKRDHLIKQVVNTNNLRKIDDTIRRTIMIKLNRQTVALTCQVNQLRKEKKKHYIKVKELKHYIDELSDLDSEKENKNGRSLYQNGDDQIVPANISIIRSKPSKHLNTSVTNREKLLPFQLYHNNKSLNKQNSYHSRNLTKCDFDESSTQLPSMLPSILKNGSISEQSSRLFNVAELDDEIMGCSKNKSKGINK